ncbi:hypothetical protein AYI70_g1618 [Smittium culicis]|uniref:Uncharacterized protein n=1 Tax=Smittium culicis TaxID=133412 RepID=A0A1R1YBW1_9FUNG|nr:hypothetical protein AYI70_g1618 [Smittium culicis]
MFVLYNSWILSDGSGSIKCIYGIFPSAFDKYLSIWNLLSCSSCISNQDVEYLGFIILSFLSCDVADINAPIVVISSIITSSNLEKSSKTDICTFASDFNSATSIAALSALLPSSHTDDNPLHLGTLQAKPPSPPPSLEYKPSFLSEISASIPHSCNTFLIRPNNISVYSAYSLLLPLKSSNTFAASPYIPAFLKNGSNFIALKVGSHTYPFSV